MQTFLPVEDFRQSAAFLDRRRLGKQRIEVWQILETLAGQKVGKRGWINHPAVQMWKGHDQILVEYGIAICQEWTGLGYKDTCLERILKFQTGAKQERPWWLGYKAFHESHQSNLVRKKPEYYRKFFPTVPDHLPYYWPNKTMLLFA